jgi:CRISPR/Cas system CMR subunit Cmr4 (Cas7 group RAMP superfamily)
MSSHVTLFKMQILADPRKKVNGIETGADVLQFVRDLKLERVQLGGDETVGRGLVALRIGR